MMECETGMKIVVLDGYAENPGDLSWDALGTFGTLTVYDRTAADQIAMRIGGAQIVYTNKTPVTRETLDACPQVRFIGVLATGYDVVDVAAARERGITVTNVPCYGTAAVAQFAIAMLLEICHHVGQHSDAVHAGRWQQSPDWCFWDTPLIELAGKTMGVVGYGRIGQAVAKIACSMGMRVLACDRTQNVASMDTDDAKFSSLDELLQNSDVISLHCPLLPETEGLINRDSIAKMKDGVILLNNSRGPLVVEADLADALNCGKVYAAGVDVVSIEPIRAGNPLLAAKNCIITPHISWASKESRQRLMDVAVDNLRQYLAGTPVNVVNG